VKRPNESHRQENRIIVRKKGQPFGKGGKEEKIREVEASTSIRDCFRGKGSSSKQKQSKLKKEKDSGSWL